MRKAHNNLSYIAEYLSSRIWITIALHLFLQNLRIFVIILLSQLTNPTKHRKKDFPKNFGKSHKFNTFSITR